MLGYLEAGRGVAVEEGSEVDELDSVRVKDMIEYLVFLTGMTRPSCSTPVCALPFVLGSSTDPMVPDWPRVV